MRAELLALTDRLTAYRFVRKLANMGIADLKESLKHVPGIEGLTMRLAGEGREVYSIGDKSVELSAGASSQDIEAAFTDYNNAFGGPPSAMSAPAVLPPSPFVDKKKLKMDLQ